MFDISENMWRDEISSYISPTDFLNLNQTCKFFNKLTNSLPKQNFIKRFFPEFYNRLVNQYQEKNLSIDKINWSQYLHTCLVCLRHFNFANPGKNNQYVLNDGFVISILLDDLENYQAHSETHNGELQINTYFASRKHNFKYSYCDDISLAHALGRQAFLDLFFKEILKKYEGQNPITYLRNFGQRCYSGLGWAIFCNQKHYLRPGAWLDSDVDGYTCQTLKKFKSDPEKIHESTLSIQNDQYSLYDLTKPDEFECSYLQKDMLKALFEDKNVYQDDIETFRKIAIKLQRPSLFQCFREAGYEFELHENHDFSSTRLRNN